MWLIAKYLISAVVIVVVSEVARTHDRVGGLLAALPFVSVMSLIWLHVGHAPTEKIANHAWFTLWYVIPSLPLFVVFPLLYNGNNFWLALGIGCVVTVLCFYLYVLLLRHFNIELL